MKKEKPHCHWSFRANPKELKGPRVLKELEDAGAQLTSINGRVWIHDTLRLEIRELDVSLPALQQSYPYLNEGRVSAYPSTVSSWWDLPPTYTIDEVIQMITTARANRTRISVVGYR